MPEGHTLHRIARRLNEAFEASPVRVSSPQGRFAAGAGMLDGHVLAEAQAWGKHLFVEFVDVGQLLHVHLGLIGAFAVDPFPGPDAPPVVGQVRLRILRPAAVPDRGQWVADLRGPMMCRLITPEEAAASTAKLGPDPLRPDADPEIAWTRIRRSSKPIGELLMDQHVLAGVGNVYRAEVLYRHRLSPFTPGATLRRASWELIWADLVRLLPLGVATSRIVTVPDQVEQVEQALVRGEDVLLTERYSAVYKHAGEPCETCGSRIQIRRMAGRNLFWCGRCQRRG